MSNITDERSSALKDYFFSDLFYERGRTAKYFNSLHSVTPGTSEKDDILTYLYTQELPPLFASYYYCTAKFCQSMCFLECRQVRFNSIFIPPLWHLVSRLLHFYEEVTIPHSLFCLLYKLQPLENKIHSPPTILIQPVHSMRREYWTQAHKNSGLGTFSIPTLPQDPKNHINWH